MGLTAATIGAAALVGSGALSAASSIAGGVAANRQGKLAAKQYEENARLAKLGADQSEVLRREDLNSTLSAIRAIRTSRGLDPESPTAFAVNEHVRKQGERGIATDRLNALNQAGQYYTAAQVARSQGRSALMSGFLRAGMYGLDTYGDLRLKSSQAKQAKG